MPHSARTACKGPYCEEERKWVDAAVVQGRRELHQPMVDPNGAWRMQTSLQLLATVVCCLSHYASPAGENAHPLGCPQTVLQSAEIRLLVLVPSALGNVRQRDSIREVRLFRRFPHATCSAARL